MEVGELFLIEDPSLALEEKILWAAERYRKEFGQQPTLCMLHPSLLKAGQKRVGRLHLEAKKTVLPNYLWIGVQREKSAPGEAKPLAR